MRYAAGMAGLKFIVEGADSRTGEYCSITVIATDLEDAECQAQQRGILVARITPDQHTPIMFHPTSTFEYKMVQIPPTIVIREQKGSEAAAYLESLVNRHASEGWEFYRVDPIGVRVQPGCLGALMGVRAGEAMYYVVTFRKSFGPT